MQQNIKSSDRVKRVLIIQAVMKHYRVPFFEKLNRNLKEAGLELRVIYSNPGTHAIAKSGFAALPTEYSRIVPAFWMHNGHLVYQAAIKEIVQADLVIVEQANKHVINYLLILLSVLGLKKVAFWGHGLNRQGNQNSLSERLKKYFINSVDWWFAYTGSTARYLEENGVSSDRITVIQNSIDTKGFRKLCGECSRAELEEKRSELGIEANARIGLFCGALYDRKRIEFLLDAACAIKKEVTSFHLLVVGTGPKSTLVQEYQSSHSWIHAIGQEYGKEKATLFMMSDLFLNPGLVGLAVLDAFTAGLPVITTDITYHSPEVEYIEKGVNGEITCDSVDEYTSSVVNLFLDDAKLIQLQKGAETSSKKYSIESMAKNYKRGLLSILG